MNLLVGEITKTMSMFMNCDCDNDNDEGDKDDENNLKQMNRVTMMVKLSCYCMLYTAKVRKPCV